MERQDIQKVIEALLFITEQPIPLKSLEAVFENEPSREELVSILQSIADDYAQRGSALEVREIAGGWQMATRPEFAPWIRKLFKDRLTYRLSTSAMETLSIVAYKQPITRSEIEEIRGVEVTAVLDTLIERKLIRIAGRRESIGRPLLYGTTPDFLKAFGLKRLEDLPSIESLVPPVTEPSVETPAAEAEPPQDPAETTETSELSESQEAVPANTDINN